MPVSDTIKQLTKLAHRFRLSYKLAFMPMYKVNINLATLTNR